MRNPLKRSVEPAPSLRERLASYRDRLAAARDKAGRMVAVNRIMVGMDMGPPKPAPVVDRDRSSWADDRPASADAAPLPHGGARLDAALLEALDDLSRLDAALRAIHEAGDQERDGDEVPGYTDLETARNGVLERLTKERAESLTGLQVKARTLLTRSVKGGGGAPFKGIATSLARDLLGLGAAAIEPQPDPVFARIAEARRLDEAHDALFRARDDGNPSAEEDAAHRAVWAFVRGPLLATPPRTAEGCKALAGFVCAFEREQGVELFEHETGRDHPVLALIARSPLL